MYIICMEIMGISVRISSIEIIIVLIYDVINDIHIIDRYMNIFRGDEIQS